MKDLYCTFEECDAVAVVRGRELCRRHYSRLAKSKSLPALGECVEEGCLRNANFRGYCMAHRWIHYPEYFKKRANAYKGVNMDEQGNTRTCSEGDCEGLARSRGLCEKHYRRTKGPVYESPNKDSEGHKVGCKASEGCDRQALSRGLCYKHWERVNRDGSETLEDPMSPCPVPGCGNLKKQAVTPLCRKCTEFRHRYSLSVERVIELFQPEVRYCGNPGCLSTTRLHLDHDHSCCAGGDKPGTRMSSCGKCVRGWLCHFCNTSLGMLQESPRKIQGLLGYLEAHRKP